MLPPSIMLTRFGCVAVISWVVFYAMLRSDVKWTVETFVPWSFWLLHFLIMFGVVARGWPFAAPAGLWPSLFKGHRRLLVGFAMTGLAIGLGAAVSAFFVEVWWGYPLFPAGAWFGISLFQASLWWALDIVPLPPLLPLAGGSRPYLDMLLGSPVCILVAVCTFQFVDFEGPPSVVEDSSNPEGPLAATWWFGQAAWIIAYIQFFANDLVMQGWPFRLLPSPWKQVGTTAACVLLGWASYVLLLEAGVDRNFVTNAIAPSVVSWSLFSSIAFRNYPFHAYTRVTRAAYVAVLYQVVVPFLWVFLCRAMLRPLWDLVEPQYSAVFTLEHLIPWYSLHYLAPLLLIHEVFFMRWPLPLGEPPLAWDEPGVMEDPHRHHHPPLQHELSRATVGGTTGASSSRFGDSLQPV